MKLVLGLTGGSGCGKSTVADYLKKRGAHIIDADEIARQVVLPGTPCLSEIERTFSGVVDEKGILDRKRLGEIVFQNPVLLSKLNQITHAYISAEILRCLALEEQGIFVIDAPLLLEAGLDSVCDACIAVLADKHLRMKRIMERDKLTETEASLRIDAQKPDDFYRNGCNYVVRNNGDFSSLKNQIDSLLKELCG